MDDPSKKDGERHLDSGNDGQDVVESVRDFDSTLFKAMSLDVPELKMPELPEIETEKVVSLEERRKVKAPVWLATAAAIALAAFFGVKTYTSSIQYDSLADEIIAHLDHEPYALRVTDKPVSDRRLNRIVPASIANLNHDAGLITYAQNCEINGKTVPHLVIQGVHGPVTILLMPDETIEAATPLEGESIHGVILPVGKGSIAIIGESPDEDLGRIEESVIDSVRWIST